MEITLLFGLYHIHRLENNTYHNEYSKENIPETTPDADPEKNL